jgi:hypothetical protein
MQRHEYAICDTSRREIPQNFRLDELDWMHYLKFGSGDILGVKSPKRPPKGKLQLNLPIATEQATPSPHRSTDLHVR